MNTLVSDRHCVAHAPAGGRGNGRWRGLAGGVGLREAPAILLGRGLRRSEAAALATGHVEWRPGRRWCF